MADDSLSELLGPALFGAFERQGYTTLTLVQRAVLAPACAQRDLRISSQTGSGKTLAVGFALRDVVAEAAAARGAARPRALVVTPTRELAKQFEAELAWLYADLGARVVSVIGGGNYRDERRALAGGPAVVVGTPGRLLDHLNRGAIEATDLQAVVLDEADRMLDLGFREELEAILAFAPEGHRTHLVSATFPREVRALADRVQDNPVHVEGTKLGEANTDIEHIIHLVLPKERVDAIVNLLLSTPGAAALVFVRTRADVGDLAEALHTAGFRVNALSGEMEQPERTRALAAFKRGAIDALVATDVAARGLDVDVARVIHAEPPTDADAYTHRSGRTGRAGRKGTSSVLVTPTSLPRTTQLLRRAGVRYRLEPVPTAETIRAAREERVFLELTADREADEGAPPLEPSPRAIALAKRICEAGHGRARDRAAALPFARGSAPRRGRARAARGHRDPAEAGASDARGPASRWRRTAPRTRGPATRRRGAAPGS